MILEVKKMGGMSVQNTYVTWQKFF